MLIGRFDCGHTVLIQRLSPTARRDVDGYLECDCCPERVEAACPQCRKVSVIRVQLRLVGSTDI